jgi:ribosome-binding protein aMBF1 (putative translation factor)
MKTTTKSKTASKGAGGTAGRRIRKSALARAVPWEEVRNRVLQDPEVRLHYEELRIRENLGRALREARERAGLTQAAVARAARTTQPVIARLEAGRGSVPTFGLLDRIARAVGLRVALTLERAA